MSDHPPRLRAQSIAATVSDLRETFLAAGVDPVRPESRERFGDEQRYLRELYHRGERRNRWIATVITAVAISFATFAITTIGPYLVAHLGWLK